MQIRSLEIFCDVARQRSFSKAAVAREISQSAVSQTIHQLEESLGVRLIDRSTRPLSLTVAGQTYFDGLVRVLGEYHCLEQEVRETRRVEGPLHIASIYSIGLTYLPDAQQEFAARFPEVEVRVDYGRNEAVVEQVLNERAEIGLVSFPRTTKEVAAVPWQNEPLRLVCSPKNPIARKTEATLEDLHGTEMVGFDDSLELRATIDQNLKRVGLRVDFRTQFDNADSIIRAIQANASCGFLPEAAVRREIATGALRVVACRALSMTRPLGIVFSRSRRPGAAGQEFGSLLLGRPLEADRRTGKPPVSDSGLDARSSVVA
ncbi:MAG: LysR family transcriptional regulator [Planctomycetota bacterium]